MKELMCPKEMPSENTTVEKYGSPVSDEQRKEDAKERRKQHRREYYLRNRERIAARGKEYHTANKEWINARKREYYAANRERLLAQKRAYRVANKERLSAWAREYRHANRDRLCTQKREYYATNREYLLAQKREYWIKNKDEITLREKKHYENNRYTLCYNLLNRNIFKSIEQIRCLCPEKVNHYMISYPFEEYAERYIKNKLHKNEVYPSQDHYADCYDAGMLAYLYSIHRCAAMDCNYVVPYIKKMIRIYIICALTVYRDAKNLCETNGFKEICLDAGIPGYGY